MIFIKSTSVEFIHVDIEIKTSCNLKGKIITFAAYFHYNNECLKYINYAEDNQNKKRS